MSRGKEHISLLAFLMAEKGIEQVVVSPGSRNAPVVILLARQKKLKLVSIADERSAGFFALGIALTTGKPVALLCTSGTAVLNYAPAVAEAYYQKVPLLLITADRPGEWIDQGDGQTIRQAGIYANYIRKSFNLPSSYDTPGSLWYANRIVNEAIDRCSYPVAGPVHLNLPLAEPLYKFDNEDVVTSVRNIGIAETSTFLSANAINRIGERWNAATSKLILVGQRRPCSELNQYLSVLADDPSVMVMTETNSNIQGNGYIGCIDRVIDGMDAATTGLLKPDILLTLGGAVVSKKIKALLRKMNPAEHWHVSEDPDEFYLDTYQSLTLTIPTNSETFARQLSERFRPAISHYRQHWSDLNQVRKKRHDEYLRGLDFCDMQIYDLIFPEIPGGSLIHFANSTPVRYAQLFDHGSGYRYYCNRGTSGIDGCVSTAAGAASVSDKPVTVITGDIGFFYDSNALWNQQLHRDFRIILINNGGGNIFRILDGPSDHEQLEPLIETAHTYKAEGLARGFGLNYFSATDKASLVNTLKLFYDFSRPGPAILEVTTPNILSATVLKDYFKFLNQ